MHSPPVLKDWGSLQRALDKQIFNYAKIGMQIRDVTKFALEQMRKNKMTNDVVTLMDKADVNIGHSIPTAYEEWTSEEKKILSNGLKDWTKAKDMIAKKRYFVNNIEDFVIKPGTAFTIEPRPKAVSKPHLPAAMNYHTVVFFKENGEKELITGFDDLFKLFGMDYMLEI